MGLRSRSGAVRVVGGLEGLDREGLGTRARERRREVERWVRRWPVRM